MLEKIPGLTGLSGERHSNIRYLFSEMLFFYIWNLLSSVGSGVTLLSLVVFLLLLIHSLVSYLLLLLLFVCLCYMNYNWRWYMFWRVRIQHLFLRNFCFIIIMISFITFRRERSTCLPHVVGAFPLYQEEEY